MKENRDDEQQKKHSRRFLVFYVIALFSIALVLVLLSYVTQVRASHKLASMTDELKQQVTVAQGAQQQMETLQKQVQEQERKLKEMESTITNLRQLLGLQENDDLQASVERLYDEQNALTLLTKAASQGPNNPEAAKSALDELMTKYGQARLDGSAPDAVFTGETVLVYQELVNKYGQA